MSYPTQKDLLSVEVSQRWIDENFLRADPYAFRDSGFRQVLNVIADELDVEPNGIFCVGSGAIGLSLNPKNIAHNELRAFGAESDLDIAVISEVYFEQAWRDLRRAAQPSVGPMDSLVEKHLSWQKKRFFDGAILANKLLPVLSFGSDWIPALVRISEFIARTLGQEIDVQIWVYRDYWSLRNYVANGIRRCREAAV